MKCPKCGSKSKIICKGHSLIPLDDGIPMERWENWLCKKGHHWIRIERWGREIKRELA